MHNQAALTYRKREYMGFFPIFVIWPSQSSLLFQCGLLCIQVVPQKQMYNKLVLTYRKREYMGFFPFLLFVIWPFV